MLFVFFLVVGGSTVLVISNGIESIGTYVIQVLPMSLQTGVGDEQWMAGWTIFYWAWWISWAPFVGMFVARISRGRTIREFVIGRRRGTRPGSASCGSPWWGHRIDSSGPARRTSSGRWGRRSCRCSRRWTCCRCRC